MILTHCFITDNHHEPFASKSHEVRWRSWLENRKCGIGTRIRNSRTPLHKRLWVDTYSTTFTIRSFKTLPFWNPPQCRFRICEHIQWVRYLCYSNFYSGPARKLIRWLSLVVANLYYCQPLLSKSQVLHSISGFVIWGILQFNYQNLLTLHIARYRGT